MHIQSAVEQKFVRPANRREDLPGGIDGLGSVVVHRANQEIFSAGSHPDFWYRVLGGSIRMVRLAADGRRQILEFQLPGDFFGFETMTERYACAEAVGRTTLIRYPRELFDRLARTDAALARRFQGMISDKLNAAHRRVFLLGRKSADERVASFLLEMFERQIGSVPELTLPMPRQDIADHIGLTIETVSRMLGRLKTEGTIEILGPSHIRLRDYDRLLKSRGDT
jgi:CRP-like cAMP-binding protein